MHDINAKLTTQKLSHFISRIIKLILVPEKISSLFQSSHPSKIFQHSEPIKSTLFHSQASKLNIADHEYRGIMNQNIDSICESQYVINTALY